MCAHSHTAVTYSQYHTAHHSYSPEMVVRQAKESTEHLKSIHGSDGCTLGCCMHCGKGTLPTDQPVNLSGRTGAGRGGWGGVPVTMTDGMRDNSSAGMMA